MSRPISSAMASSSASSSSSSPSLSRQQQHQLRRRDEKETLLRKPPPILMTEAERKERHEKRFLLLLSALVLACFCIYVTPENYRDSVRTFGMEKIDSSITHIHSVTAKTSSFFQNVFSLNFIHAAAFSDKTDHIEIFVIVQPENTRDKEGFERIRNKFPAAQTTLGITAAEWPKNIKEAEWAVAPIRELNKEFFNTNKYHYSSKFMKELERTPDSLENMPWIGLIDERNPKTGKLTKDRMGIAHHLGHTRAWVMESDGNEIPDRTLEMRQLLRNVPDDFDFISLGPHYDEVCVRTEHTVGFFPSNNCEKSRFEFEVEKDPNDKYSRAGTKTFYYWPKMGTSAGFQSYLVGPNFYEKVTRYMARHGADMIDAYMFGHICQNNYVSEEARDGGLEPPKGFDDLSTKRLTSRDESGLKILNCYVIGPVEEKIVESDEGGIEKDKDSATESTSAGASTEENMEGSPLGEDESSSLKQVQGDSNESFDDLLSRFSAKHPVAEKKSKKHGSRKKSAGTNAQ
ncbi:unnamed protein product [Bathycoccus prasinos]